MGIVIECPNETYSLENYNNVRLFLAGGITNCPDWQSKILQRFTKNEGLTIYNPRRKDFPMGDPEAGEQQVVWEFEKLRDADIILYWFSKGSLNPIVLYELGLWGNSDLSRPIFIGIDPEYERRYDVEIQTKLARPDIEFAYSIDELYNQVNNYLKS